MSRFERWDPEHPSLFGRDLDEGRRRRDEGTKRVLMALPFDPWSRNAERAIKALADHGQRFTSESVRSYAGDPPKPNALGAALNHAAKAGLIEWRGELEQSERPEAHGRWLKVWHGVASPDATSAPAPPHRTSPRGGGHPSKELS